MAPIYLDHAAATPLDPAVLVAMQPYFAERFYNPSALYLSAKQVAADIRQAREQVARCLGARPGEIIFTAGGTEANNLAIHGVMAMFPDTKLVVSAIEHESVLRPARQYPCQEVTVSKDGIVSIEALREAIDDETVLVSIMTANNEIGSLQPLAPIGTLIKEIRRERQQSGNKLPLYMHTDACQAINYVDCRKLLASGYIDLLTLNGGKIYGPKQSGALYRRATVQLKPQVMGGGQEMGVRSGTENVPAIMGLAAALERADARRQSEVKRLQSLQRLMFERIATDIPQAFVNGSRKHRLPNNVHITIPGQDNERIIMALDEAGVMAAAGSACSASNDEPSHVLRALGLSQPEAQASLRFTMGRATTEAEAQQAVARLCAIIR